MSENLFYKMELSNIIQISLVKTEIFRFQGWYSQITQYI